MLPIIEADIECRDWAGGSLKHGRSVAVSLLRRALLAGSSLRQGTVVLLVSRRGSVALCAGQHRQCVAATGVAAWAA